MTGSDHDGKDEGAPRKPDAREDVGKGGTPDGDTKAVRPKGSGEAPAARLLRFPLSRTRPPGQPGMREHVGPSPMARALGAPVEQTTGHWCSRCQAIWYGYLLEVECPVCGNRNG